MIWRVSREHVLLAGGPAAAILQIAHPEVALGVAHHSDFKRDTLGRLARTLEAVYTITFAPRPEVEAMAARVRASHAKVRGKGYSAFSPDAQMWVLATLIQLAVESFERFVAPLTPENRESFHRDMRVFGTWFGLDVSHGPQNWADFSAYYRTMLENPVLGSLPLSRDMASHIAFPRRPALRLLHPLSGFLAREFLPSPVRERLGFERTVSTRMLAAVADAAVPRVLPWLPARVRFVSRSLKARG